jgi:hypothetical protein
MSASPEAFREVGRPANRCRLCFLPKPCDHCISLARLSYSVVRLWQIALAFDERSGSKQRRDGHLLPVQRRCVVQLSVE